MRRPYSIHITDMYDKDVFINVRIFYARCGYRFVGFNKSAVDLIVVLRGTTQKLKRFSGIVHVYDYVKNFKKYGEYIDTSLPDIYLISLEPELELGFKNVVRAYLPVIPEFWKKLTQKKSKALRLSHIGSYKGLNDPIEQGMISLLKREKATVFGFNWLKAGIIADGLSHLRSNRMFSQSKVTVGLMYHYQRGRTLSSRVWHGPIHGCVLLSHKCEEVEGLRIPGAVYTESWDEVDLGALFVVDSETLSISACNYWEKHTTELAYKLGMRMTRKSGCLEKWLGFYELKIKHTRAVFFSRVFATLRAIKKTYTHFEA